MATITREIPLKVPADRAWTALRDVGRAADVFPGVLVDSQIVGDVRTVTFSNGLVVRERIVTVDDERRRLAYAVIEGSPTHHNASLQVLAEGESRCRIVWTTDLLPDDLEPSIRALVDQGAEALRRSLEGEQ
jgi:hypothetical protein